MKHDYMHEESRGEVSGISKNLNGMVEVHIISSKIVEVKKGIFMSIHAVCFHTRFVNIITWVNECCRLICYGTNGVF